MLGSAALHAAWNALVAGARDTHATSAVALLIGATAFAVPAALTWRLDGAAVPYVVASGLLELAYFALLAAAYARADYTLVYPIARGAAPVLVLAVSVTALGADVSAVAAGGVLLVAAGVLLVRGIGRGGDPAALGLALGVAACIAAYTLVDDHGVEHASPLAYFEVVLVICALPYAAGVAHFRGRSALRAAAADRRAVPAGLGMVGAYVLVLAALERAEAAPVAALRETSVVMAAGGAALAGRRRVPRARIAGAALVVSGVAAIALG